MVINHLLTGMILQVKHAQISMRSLIWLKGILQQESHTTSSQQSFHQQSDTRSLMQGGPLLVTNRLR